MNIAVEMDTKCKISITSEDKMTMIIIKKITSMNLHKIIDYNESII